MHFNLTDFGRDITKLFTSVSKLCIRYATKLKDQSKPSEGLTKHT